MVSLSRSMTIFVKVNIVVAMFEKLLTIQGWEVVHFAHSNVQNEVTVQYQHIIVH